MPNHLTSRTLKNGKKTWTVRFPSGAVFVDPNDPEQRKRQRWTTQTFKTEKAAKAHLRKLEDQRETGGVIVPTRETLKEYLKRYFASVELRENTRKSYLEVLRLYVQPTLGSVPVAKIRTLDVQAIYDAMKDRGLSARSIRYVHSVFHSALDQAVDWKLIRRNPTKGVRLPKETKTEIRYLAGVEVPAFMGSAWFDELGLFFEMMLATAARPSELMGLRWSSVDLENGSIRVVETLVRDGEKWYLRPPKTKQATRTLPIPARTVQTLREHRADQGERRLKMGSSWSDNRFVFASAIGEPLERHNLIHRHYRPTLKRATEAVYPADAAAKDPEMQRKRDAMLATTLYGLRHTAATLMLERGIDAKTVSDRLGHKSVAFTLDTYVHVSPAMKDDATAVLGAALYE